MKKRSVKKRTLLNKILVSLLILLIAILIVLILLWIIFYIFYGNSFLSENDQLKTFGIFGYLDSNSNIEFPYNCLDEDLNNFWNSVFIENENSIIKLNDSNCSNFLLYKVLNSAQVFLIYGLKKENRKGINFSFYAIHGNFSNNIISNISSINSQNINNYSFIQGIINTVINALVSNSDDLISERNINNISEAKDEFIKIFENDGSFFEDFYPELSLNYYGFKDLGFGGVNKNKSAEFWNYNLIYLKPINISLIRNISDITLSGGFTYYNNQIDLQNYFENLICNDPLLIFSYELSSNNNTILFNTLKNNNFDSNCMIDFDARATNGGVYTMNISLQYPGIQKSTSNNFIVTIYGCNDSDLGPNRFIQGHINNQSLNYNDNCINDSLIKEYYCINDNIFFVVLECGTGYHCINNSCMNISKNNAPEFLNNTCGEIVFLKNKNYEINMKKCFNDKDRNSLDFRYENGSNKNLSIIPSIDQNLTLIPDHNWIGDGYFYLFANDSINETKGKVVFHVLNYSNNTSVAVPPVINQTSNRTQQITISQNLEIIEPYPVAENIEITTSSNRVFSIGNKEYDNINWYLNNILVKQGSSYYKLETLNKGNYVLKVEVIKQDKTALKIWNIYVKETPALGRNFDVVETLFYSIIAVIIIIIIIILWLFIIEIKRTKMKKFNFGLSEIVVRGEKPQLSFNPAFRKDFYPKKERY